MSDHFLQNPRPEPGRPPGSGSTAATAGAAGIASRPMNAEPLILDLVYAHEAVHADRVFLTQPLGGDRVLDLRWGQVLDQARRMAAHLQSLGLPPRHDHCAGAYALRDRAQARRCAVRGQHEGRTAGDDAPLWRRCGDRRGCGYGYGCRQRRPGGGHGGCRLPRGGRDGRRRQLAPGIGRQRGNWQREQQAQVAAKEDLQLSRMVTSSFIRLARYGQSV